MIGNDIVDLQEARLKSNWERPGFLEKVFSSTEQNLIHQSEHPSQIVWRLWTMKESAYKFYLQKKPSAIRGFYPAKIETQLHSSSMGLVSIKGIVLSTTSIIHPDYIFSTAFFKKNIPTETVIFSIAEGHHQFQSTFTRQKLLDSLAQKKRLNRVDLAIKKDINNIPKIFYQKKLLPFNCSLTHHGNYGGYSISSI